MRLSYVTSAIVLRTWPFGESDKIVSFLTEDHGKLRGIAKGAKRSVKRFGNCLEPFSLVRLRFQERSAGGLVFILGCELMRSFHKLASGLDRIAFASYCVEVTEGMVGEGEENRPLFEHLRSALSHLEGEGASFSFLASFELKLLRLAGYRPVLDRCRACSAAWLRGGHGAWCFSFRDGGLLCQGCSRSRKEVVPLAGAALDAIADLERDVAFGWGKNLSPGIVREIENVIGKFIRFQLDREIKSAPFLHKLSAV
ncbi:MAG TPA: DNA repair protein RecO [candidate division Zixibacteria bacterium]|nr:DNA repair protein RecO [candidate division Zixibacteria bacterium]